MLGAGYMFSHTTLSLHVFLCVELATCFPSNNLPYSWKKRRPQIQRQTWCLISMPDVNDFGHVALLSNQKGEKNQKTNCNSQEVHKWSFRGSILDSIITEGRDSVSVFSVVHVALWAPFKWQTPKCEQQTEPEKSARRKECEHLCSPFGFNKSSHVTKIVDFHDRTENACTVSTARCPIQSLRKVF